MGAKSTIAQKSHREPQWETRSFLDLMPDAIVAIDGRGIIRRVNDQLLDMFGYKSTELLGKQIEILLPNRFRQAHVNQRTGYRSNPRTRSMGEGLDLYGRRKDGSEVPLDIMLRPVSGEELVLAVIRDITARKEVSEKLKHLAYFDQLTGLPNRAALYADLEGLLKPGKAGARRRTGIVLFDLDGFKDVNDTLGHSVGDDLLKAVVLRWQSDLGPNSKIYRLGGDEFVLLMPSCGNPVDIATTVDRMLNSLNAEFEFNNRVFHVGASAGIAMAPADGSNVEDLLANVDIALYRAKATERGGYAFFHPSQRAETQARHSLDLELRLGFSRGEFEVYFQPQIRLSDGALVGAEALLRWRRGQQGIVAPAAFIDALAASNIAHEVGTWILRTACEKAAAWRARHFGPLRLAVNLFAAQVQGATLVHDVERILAATGLPPESLELEITENIALYCPEKAMAPFDGLRKMGVSLALDDFGTGYGSLNSLMQIPLSHIKIDRSFIRNVCDDDRHRAIVRSLIMLAHNIGLEVIAEGVETANQIAFLRAEQCDEAQGYFFAKPLAPAQMEAMLGTRFRGGGPVAAPARK